MLYEVITQGFVHHPFPDLDGQGMSFDNRQKLKGRDKSSLGVLRITSYNVCYTKLLRYQLQQGNFVERLREILATHSNVGRNQLMLEVLETSALEDLVV